MSWGEGAIHIGSRFGTRAQWDNISSAETYLFLYRQLTHDHGVEPIQATDILESAFMATLDELRQRPACH